MINNDTDNRPKEPPLILRAQSVSASIYAELPPRWLWNPYIPRARVTVLVGDPGIGKSLLLAHLAGCVTAARPFPAPTPEDDTLNHPADAWFGAPEDSETDVLVPRLRCAGANLERVHIIHRVGAHLPRSHFGPDKRPDDPVTTESAVFPLTLPLHGGALADVLRQNEKTRLLVLDPLHNFIARPRNPRRFQLENDSAYVRDTHDLTAGVMASLNEIARAGLAIVAVAHLTKKSDAQLLYRARGALSLISAARSVLYLAADPQDPDRRILSQIKSVSGPPAPPLAFRIRPGPRLEFEPPGALKNRPDLFTLRGELYSALEEACAWITDALAAGPLPALEVVKRSRADGISPATLNRAKFILRVRSVKLGPDWHWSTPEQFANSSLSK